MRYFVLIRLLRMLLMLLLVSVVVFFLSRAVPGGPAGISVDPGVRAEDIARVRNNLGLDRPIAVQYLEWFSSVFFRFDLGKSYVTGEPVREMIMSHLAATVELMATAFCMAFLGAVILGTLWSKWRCGVLNEFLSIISSAGMSIPVFWLGIMAIALFSVRLGWFPAGGRVIKSGAASFTEHLRHIFLPASILALAYFSTWSRYVKSGMLTVSGAAYIKTARAKGLGEGRIIFKHALKNAIIPFVTVAMMQVPTVFAGAVVTETVFSWPGMGRLFYEGLERHDYPRVMGIVIVSAFLVILFNTVADVILRMLDPRVGFQMKDPRTGWIGSVPARS